MLKLIKETFADWSEDRASRLAAALSFYTMISLAPLVVLVVAVAGAFWGREAVTGQLAREIQNLVGLDTARFLQDVVQGAQEPKSGVLASVLGIVTLLLGASGVFGQLQDALNTIWEVKPKKRGLLGTIRARFLSMSMVLGIGFLLLVSTVASAGIAAFSNYLAAGAEIIHVLLSLGIFTLLFAAMFKVLPDVKIAWRDVWIGAAVTAGLFTLGKVLIGLYLGQSAVANSYGAAGALVLLLLWVYYSAQIFFLGAEFTQVYARHYGSRIVPARGAEPVTEEARAQQGMPGKKPTPKNLEFSPRRPHAAP